MACITLRDANGNVIGHACGVRVPRCKECRAPREFLCDWKLAGEKAGKTCDRNLCGRCAQSPAPEKHLCPEHWRMWQSHPARKRSDAR
jgi:hypothetical protein